MGSLTGTYVKVRDLEEGMIVEISDTFTRCTVMVDNVLRWLSSDTFVVRAAFENGLMRDFVLNGDTTLKVAEDGNV